MKTQKSTNGSQRWYNGNRAAGIKYSFTDGKDDEDDNKEISLLIPVWRAYFQSKCLEIDSLSTCPVNRQRFNRCNKQ